MKIKLNGVGWGWGGGGVGGQGVGGVVKEWRMFIQVKKKIHLTEGERRSNAQNKKKQDLHKEFKC